jgi:hypothetical protein
VFSAEEEVAGEASEGEVGAGEEDGEEEEKFSELGHGVYL